MLFNLKCRRVAVWLLSFVVSACSASAPGGDDDEGPDAASSGGATGDGDGTLPGSGGSDEGTGGSETEGTGGFSSGGCELPACDDFESAELGASWSKILDYSGSGNALNVALDSTEAHSGVQSVRVDGTSGVFGLAKQAPGDRFYVRAWMKVDPNFAGDPALTGIGQGPNSEVRLRAFRTGGGVLLAGNDSSDSGLVPNAKDGNGCPTCAVMPADWFCTEIFFDRVAETMTVWIDDALAVDVTAESGWNWPVLVDHLRLGPVALSGTGPIMWLDDVAFSDSPIGCN